jgi:hypothetical protein
MQLLVKARAKLADKDEDIGDLETIDDIRNGLLVEATIHGYYDEKRVVILKVPLQCGLSSLSPLI